MYNRYVPQADGSYRRNKVEDPGKQSRQVPQSKPPQPKPPQPQNCHPQETCGPDPKPNNHALPANPPHQGKQVGGFLRQLLPKDFDTADLIIVLLLLLLAGDCEEERNTAMLTLVLYLFM